MELACSIHWFYWPDRTFALDEEYIAGWLAMFPATDLTPFTGIHSVPPCCFVRFENGRQKLRQYWDFDPERKSVTEAMRNTKNISARSSQNPSVGDSDPTPRFSPS